MSANTKKIDPGKSKPMVAKVFEAEIPPLPGSMNRVPDTVKLEIGSSARESLVLMIYYMYKTNQISRNIMRSMLMSMKDNATAEEAAQWIVKEAAKV